MASGRQLAAIMFTDISGFSAMMQKDESYAKRILKRHRSVLSECHEQFGGKILQYIGDGTLSIFKSAVSAVECAVAMQQEFIKAPHVPLRIGIHSGDITYDDTGAFGDGVNVCSRIERLCIPGAIYISDKVFDDIKNHSWLTAKHLGPFNLRNISLPMHLYAVSARGIVIPAPGDIETLPEYEPELAEEIEESGSKRKWVAVLLAFFFGMFGVHRFYLGQKPKGIAYLVAFIIAMIITTEGNVPFVAFMAILAFIDSILFLVMPQKDFDRKYNQVKTEKKKQPERKIPARKEKVQKPNRRSRLMQKARQAITKGRYQDSIKILYRVLDLNELDPDAHYDLAICFSMLKEEKEAFSHLTLAVENGLSDLSRIDRDIHLHYLRSRPEYQGYKENGYKHPQALPNPREDLLDDNTFDPMILDKIELLGDRLERGELTQQEFEIEKKKILGTK